MYNYDRILIHIFHIFMNYYIIPTKNMKIVLNTSFANKDSNYVSDSFTRNINSLCCQVNEFENYYKEIIPTNIIDDIHKINNVYSYVFDVVTRDVEVYLNTSKQQKEIQLFFVIIELCNTFECIKYTMNMFPSNIVYIGNNSDIFQNTLQYIHKTPPGIDQLNIMCSTLDKLYQQVHNGENLEKINENGFLFFDIDYEKDDIGDIKNYTLYLLKCIYIALKTKKGCIIKTWEIIYKPIIDSIYILSGVYKNVYISKPTTTQYQYDRFVICKDINQLYETRENNDELVNNISSTISYISDKYETNKNSLDNKLCIKSVIENTLSQHFINKIEESTLIVGQKNIEYYENLIVIFKLYGKDDKLDMAKKNSIIKCAQWCSKNNIPIKSTHTV